MRIENLWFLQRNLNRSYQLDGMITELQDGGYLPLIELITCEDGEIEINDGHHRVAAIWLSGRKTLRKDEYMIWEGYSSRNRKGKIQKILLPPPINHRIPA